jgi:hypothetical protein
MDEFFELAGLAEFAEFIRFEPGQLRKPGQPGQLLTKEKIYR